VLGLRRRSGRILLSVRSNVPETTSRNGVKSINREVDLPERRHGDDGVPERFWDAGEGGLRFVLFRVEHDRREHDDGHRQREEQEAEFTGARLERVAEDAQTLRVSRELEDAEHRGSADPASDAKT